MTLPAALEPLRSPVYRGLWFAWLAANMTMWMNDVSAAWLMTTLTTSPVMVALVQTASTLPVLLLAVPSGATADIVDRRLYFAATQLWVSATALALAALSLVGALTAPVLLALTFLNGVGLAMRLPVFSAIVPQVVPRAQLPTALALSGISMNLSRVIGPVLAGALIAAASPALVFVLNALLSVLAFGLILRWRSTPRTSPLPGERFIGAMRVGLNFALQSPRLRGVMWRSFLFFLQASALTSLLPLVARGLHGGGPGTFTMLLSCLGVGAILAALLAPRLRQRWGRDDFVLGGTLAHALMAVLIVTAQEIWLAVPAMVVVGMAWLLTANSLSVVAQSVLPDWVRARGMAIYQMSLMGGAACGGLVWGQVAGLAGVDAAVLGSSALGMVVWLLTRRRHIDAGPELDYSPAPATPRPEPAIPVEPEEGPVMVTLEYLVDPARADDFAAVMRRTRGARLRQGALSWGLFRDTADPGRYVEYFVDENWLEHQRRLERFTAFDAELRAQRLAFHLGPEPPKMQRYVADHRVERPSPPV